MSNWFGLSILPYFVKRKCLSFLCQVPYLNNITTLIPFGVIRHIATTAKFLFENVVVAMLIFSISNFKFE